MLVTDWARGDCGASLSNSNGGLALSDCQIFTQYPQVENSISKNLNLKILIKFFNLHHDANFR
jgi:hypothetical protein